MRLVNVRDLDPGQTLASDVSNLHGQVIAPAGTVIAPRLLYARRGGGGTDHGVEIAAVLPRSGGQSSQPRLSHAHHRNDCYGKNKPTAHQDSCSTNSSPQA
jgi:hypothetical protein